MSDGTIEFKSTTSGGFVFHDIPTIKLGSTGREQLEEVLKQDKELEEKVRRRKELDNAMKRLEKMALGDKFKTSKNNKGETSNELERRAAQHQNISYDEHSGRWMGCGNTDLDEFFAHCHTAREHSCDRMLDEICGFLKDIKKRMEQPVIYKDRVIVKRSPYEPKPESLAKSKRISIGSVLRPCIYFLYDEDKIIYIGQSITPYSRIAAHNKDKNFSSVRLFACRKDRLDYWERVLIKRYTPKLNKAHNNGKPARMKIHKKQRYIHGVRQEQRAVTPLGFALSNHASISFPAPPPNTVKAL